jgi:hypothetical protein
MSIPAALALVLVLCAAGYGLAHLIIAAWCIPCRLFGNMK